MRSAICASRLKTITNHIIPSVLYFQIAQNAQYIDSALVEAAFDSDNHSTVSKPTKSHRKKQITRNLQSVQQQLVMLKSMRGRPNLSEREKLDVLHVFFHSVPILWNQKVVPDQFTQFREQVNF